jgi:hypothetical protein
MLKTFKQFLKAKTAKVPIADYYPSHGAHSQEKVPVADYTPSHGKHSVQEAIKLPQTTPISHCLRNIQFATTNPPISITKDKKNQEVPGPLAGNSKN